MKAMILAAGLGTRFRPHTDVLAKPALPFLNIPLLGYSLFHIESLGDVTDVVLNTHHLPATVRTVADALASTSAGAGQKYSLHFSDEQPKILGSGGGIRRAQKFLSTSTGNGHFIVSNGDEVIFFEKSGGFRRLVDAHIKSGALATLMTMDHPDVGVHMNGLRVAADGQITEYSVREKGLAHFTGVFVFSERIFSYMPPLEEFHIFKDVLVPAQKRGEKVMAHHDNALLWLETTDEKSFLDSTSQALDQLLPGATYGTDLAAIMKRFTPGVTQAREGLWLGPGAKFDGKLGSGARCLLGAGAEANAAVAVNDFAVLGTGAIVKNGYLNRAVVREGKAVNDDINKSLIL